jgi:tyrosine-protein phosphatase SIW14
MLACLFCLSLVAPVTAATPRIAGASRTAKSDRDLPNFAQVTPGLYRGAAPTTAGFARLKALGVRTIIDLRIEKHGQAAEVAATKALGFSRLRIPLGREAPTKKQVATFLSTVNDPAQQPVYVHCQYGADRTGAMIGIYRVTHDGWTFDQAYKEMRRYGFKPFLTELKGSVAAHARSPRA